MAERLGIGARFVALAVVWGASFLFGVVCPASGRACEIAFEPISHVE
ncbi:hypothetical protein QRX50_32405 [Amycolatopsis carbonis]|uniref:Uncharacterized protein n=1 Tax=Amycolatopsis carbonis TaxID=715471 RepID=A0A9Y2IBN8_9PSEU|nr:hypothetical protein [Amycolatopsis sp. 2-15]WIX76155.1 hypothetical protein QRX50_32405 [Amycolatopsis sp. 2-15]